MTPSKGSDEKQDISPRAAIGLFSFAHFSHHLSTALLNPMLPWIRTGFGPDFTLSYTQSGALVSAFALISGVMQAPIGGLADRFGRRPLMAFGGLAGVALASLLLASSPSGEIGYYQVLFGLVVMGFMASAYHPLAGSFISQFVPSTQRGRAYGIHLTGGNLGFLVAPVVGGGIAYLWGWRAAYATLPLTGIAAAWLFWRMTARQPSEGGNGVARKRLLDLSVLSTARPVLPILSLSVFIHMVDASVSSFLPLFIVDKHHVEPAVAAVTVAIISAAGLFGAPFGGTLSDRIGRKPLILLSMTLEGPAIFLVTLMPFGWWLFGAIAFLGLARSLRNPVMETVIADNIPQERRATAFGLYYFFNAEAGGLAVPVVGYAIDRAGLDASFLGLVVAAVLAATVALALRQQLKVILVPER